MGKGMRCVAGLLCLSIATAGLAQQVPLSAGQRDGVARLIHAIEEASQAAFLEDDWSQMAQLYPAHTFDCWNRSGEMHRYAFLSMLPLHVEEYEVTSLDDNYTFGSLDPSGLHATHVLRVRYRESLPNLSWPAMRLLRERHFYLEIRGDEVTLDHPCPDKEVVERRAIATTFPMISTASARDLVDEMSSDERAALRRQIVAGEFPVTAFWQLRQKYPLPEPQILLMLDTIYTPDD